MNSTQNHLPIKNIHDDLIFLKDGSVSMVLQTSAVNFDLLSEREQIAIIDAFASFLNSLSFGIQIIIRSKRLDITSYLKSLDQTLQKQQNPLLKDLMRRYMNFIITITSQNEVLDKQFFIIINISSLEIGLVTNTEKDLPKVLGSLVPRRDHVVKQLNRIGIKADQMTTEELVKLFYDMYNEEPITEVGEQKPVNSQQSTVNPPNQPVYAPTQPTPVQQPQQTIQSAPQIPINPPSSTVNPPTLYPPRVIHQSTPFVVEELPDEYTHV